MSNRSLSRSILKLSRTRFLIASFFNPHCSSPLLDAAGVPLGTVQALLGHSSPEVTRQIYLRAIPTEQRRAVEEVEKLLVGPKWTQIEEIVGRPN